MRKILILSTVFPLSLIVFAQNDADAAWSTTRWQSKNNSAIKDVESKVEDAKKKITDYIDKHMKKNSADSEEALEQQTTANLANHSHLVGALGGHSQNQAVMARQSAGIDTYVRGTSIAEGVCIIGSGNMSTEMIHEAAEKATDDDIEESMDIINSEAGQISENGLLDFRRKLFQEATSMCDPKGNGGANVYCSGSGTSHITLATLLRPVAYRKDPSVNRSLDYLKNVLYARIPVSVNPDLLDQPNTEVMNMVVESDRLKAEMSIGQTVFSMIRGNRTKTPTSPSAAKSLRQRYEAGGWSAARIDKVLKDGMSKNSLYEALTVGSSNTKFLMQELTSLNPVKLLQFIGGQVALNNVLQFEQYKLLEAIALTNATNIVVNRDDAIKDLNSRISALNAR